MNAVTTIRARNGLCAEAYWAIRLWCERSGFLFSDIINSLLPPTAYYLQHAATVFPDSGLCKVSMNMGELDIYRVNPFNGQIMPLRRDTKSVSRGVITEEEIKQALTEWRQRNSEGLCPADHLIAKKNYELTSSTSI